MSITLDQARTRTPATGAEYRTLWRWHFYAGLFVMPFLLVLAITGTLYCFKPQLEPLLYPQLLRVQPQATAKLDADRLLAAAQRSLPASSVPVSLQVQDGADRSAEFVFRLPDAQSWSVYVNPYDGHVLGRLSVSNRFMQVTRMLHRKLLLGKPGELLMELVACWTLVMIGTGIALWWPRPPNGQRPQLRPDFSLEGRPFWRSLHAALGIWLAAGALAFVLTGMPWTGSWGRYFKSLAASMNLDAPPGAWGGSSIRSVRPGTQGSQAASPAEGASMPHHHAGDDAEPARVMDQLPVPMVPWAVGNSRIPASTEAADSRRIPIQQVIDQVAALGVRTDYSLALPASPDSVYTASYFPSDPKLERTIHIDQYRGSVLRDIRYADYGPIAQAVSYGTSLHMGRYFGLANQIVSALISVGLGVLALSGAVMWWKRRPSFALGAPPREALAPPMRGWKAGLVLLGIIFPLMGLSLVLVWALDWLLIQRPARQMA